MVTCFASLQKRVVKHLMQITPLPVPTNAPDVIISRPGVNLALSEVVKERRWVLFRGSSASGKTTSMHYFIRNQLRTGSSDADTNVAGERTIQVPVTCHWDLRNCRDVEEGLRALRTAMGLCTPARVLYHSSFSALKP